MRRSVRGSPRLWLFALLYGALIFASIGSFISAGDLQFGRKPLQNLIKTAGELSRPSLLDIWYGNPHLEFKSDDGVVLRVEDQRASEQRYLIALLEAIWTTLKVATLGSLIAALAALPFGVIAARNMGLARWLAVPVRLMLDMARAIHALVFGLLLVGIIGLGPMAGVLAIALHAFGTYGKLYAETLETIDQRWITSGMVIGMTPLQTVLHALPRTLLPQILSIHLYIWEFNVRDSTVLGLIGVGGLGLLVSEAVSLFQWGRLATLLIAIVLLVIGFDRISARMRAVLAERTR